VGRFDMIGVNPLNLLAIKVGTIAEIPKAVI
jgi:hypothetical protein